MIARLRVDQLSVDPHTGAAALNAALDDIADVQFMSDCLHVQRLAFVGKRRIAGDDDGASYARKIGREALGDPVDEMLMARFAAQIGEGSTAIERRGGSCLVGRETVGFSVALSELSLSASALIGAANL